MSSKDPHGSSPASAKEERLAKALRENLARRKALVRAKKQRAEAETGTPVPAGPAREDDPSS